MFYCGKKKTEDVCRICDPLFSITAKADAGEYAVVDDVAVAPTATRRPDEMLAAAPENILRHDTVSSMHIYDFIW